MRRDVALGGIFLVAIGVVVAVVRALDLLGADTLRLLALILAVPGGVAVMALGLTPLVRAWRIPVTPPVERHVIKETRLQHTIDRRAPAPAAPELPPYRQLNLYPGLQSAEWRAGLLTSGQGDAGADGWYREVTVDEDAPAEWE